MSVSDGRGLQAVPGLPRAEPIEDLVWRVKAPFRTPGLQLTLVQAHYLFDLEPTVCQAILELLCAEGFLARSREGAYTRSDFVPPIRR